MTSKDIKLELSRMFSDDNKTKPWHHWVDHVIMGCLVLNALVLFLATYDSLNTSVGLLLNIVDIITSLFFVVEVTARIWVADLMDDEYKGVKGRVKYCLTPAGLIDLLATYPPIFGWVFSFSSSILKSLRVLRLIRIFRFMNAFKLLSNAINNKRQELLLSLGFLAVITFMLSLILFYVEHAAHPELYTNGMDSVMWAFMQYIGDPGGFAGDGPVTFAGRIISCVIGVLGIAVFAVPAGLIGSGFIEEVEETRRERSCQENAAKIRNAFQRMQCRYTKFQVVPIYYTIPQLQVQTGMTEDDILSAVDHVDDLRLTNLAKGQPIEDRPVDQLAVEYFVVNRPYGCCINRGSKVTIVETSNHAEAAMAGFAFYLAMIGGFNYISRELIVKKPSQSYYNYTDENCDPYLPLFLEDLNKMAFAEDHFVFYVLAASGGMEPKLPTQVHFNYGGKKGDETYNDPNRTLHKTEVFEAMYQDVANELKEQFDIDSDKQRYYDTSRPGNIMRKMKNADRVNNITLRVEWPMVIFDLRRYAIAKTLADAFNRHFEALKDITYDPILKIKDVGYKGYEQ